MNSTLALACLTSKWHRVALFILIACSSGALAQTPTNPSPRPQASPSPTQALERRFFKNILQDQRAIWTSPLHIDSDDSKWLVPLGLSTTALLFTDQYTAAALHSDRTRLNVSRDVSYLGSAYATGAISGAFYLVGRAKNDARARETGILAAQALLNGVSVGEALKFGTQRTRPRQDIQGEFFEGGKSFPSGHAINSWALATVIASEYKHRPFVRFGAFGLATLVSASRFTGGNHFLSDVLIGSAIGYGIGRYVYRTHHDPNLERHHDNMSTHGHSKLLPLISPAYERSSRSYRIKLAWKL
jgi:membrane-associated phospholipid phosphatase